MKQKLTTIVCCLILIAFGCRKKEKPIESTWTWNGEKHSTIADAVIGKAIAMLGNDDTNDGFKLVFFLPYLPGGDRKLWTIVGDNASQNPTVAGLFFYLNRIAYVISPNNKIPLISLSNNGKARYELEGAWFVNNHNPQDSVFITAVLNNN